MEDSMFLKLTRPDEILKIIKSMNRKNTGGWNGFSRKIATTTRVAISSI